MVKTVMAEMALVKVAVMEITVIEPVVSEVSAVRLEGVMVEECSTVMPVVPPVAPSPSKSAEESDSKSNAERESDAAPKNSRLRIPAWVRDYRPSVHQPRIIGRHIDHLRISRLDNDRLALCRYLLLVGATQMAGLLCLLAHHLDSIGHILRIVDIGLA